MKTACVSAILVLAVVAAACGNSSSPAAQSSHSVGDPTVDKLAQVLTRGTLVVAVNSAYPPQSYAVRGAKRPQGTKCAENQLAGNQMAGYDVATGKAVAKALGVEPCFVTPAWTEITAGQWGNRWDIAYASGAINTDRTPRLWMTTPYSSQPQRYFVLKSSPYFKPSDLDGKTIGVCNSCTVEFYLKGHLVIPGVPTPIDVKDPKIVTYAVEPPGLKATSEGKIDAYLSSEPVGMEAIHQGEPLRPLAGNAFTMYLTGFLDKDSSFTQAAFADRVDQIMTHLQQTGVLKRLSLKYFHKDYGSGAANYNIAQLHQDIPTTPAS
jgi:polar amino acid transport system substrate-binding protein